MSVKNVDFSSEIKCIYQEFAQKTIQCSQKSAVIFDKQSLSYNEVLHYVQQLSSYLINQCSVKQNQIIYIFMERSIEMMISVLAMSACGLFYTMLDSNNSYLQPTDLIKDRTKSHIVLMHLPTKNTFSNAINDNIRLINVDEILTNKHNSKIIF
ncbi:unnamed protein product, partial [Didymodactylos carnosus]